MSKKTKKTSEAIPVHIYFVLDRSGSMGGLHDAVVTGIKEFITEQKAQPGKCRLSMIQFDSSDPHEILYDAVKIEDVSEAGIEQFNPRGMTPLLDAEGWMINRAQERQRDRERDGKKKEAVLFVTFTDGMENASTEWNRERLTAAKKDCEDGGWTFTYLGTGHDAYGQSKGIGTHVNSVQQFDQSAMGVKSVMASVSGATRGMRSAAFAGDSGAISSENLYNNAYFDEGKTGETVTEDTDDKETVDSSA